MKLGYKLISLYTATVVAGLLVSIGSNWIYSSIREEVAVENEIAALGVEYAAEIERNLYQSLLLVQTMHHYNDTDSETSQSITEFRTIEEQLRTGIASFKINLELIKELFIHSKNSLTPEQAENLDSLEKKFRLYENLIYEVVKLTEAGSKDTEQMFYVTIEPYFMQNVLPAIIRLREYMKHHREVANIRINEGLVDVQYYTILAYTITFILVIGLVIIITQSLVRPVKILSAAAKKVAAGEYNQSIAIKSNDEIGELGKAFNDMMESLKNRTISRDYLDSIIEALGEGLFVTNYDGIVLRANSACFSMLGYTKEKFIGIHLSEFCMEYGQKAMPKADFCSEVIFTRKNSEHFDVLLSRTNLDNLPGDAQGYLFLASDITPQKKLESQLRSSLEEKKMLLAEIHHRVKNNLAVISGLLQLQSWKTKSEEAQEVLKDSQLRVQSIALVHEMLYESDSLAYIKFDNYINDLLQAISSMYIDTGLDIALHSDVKNVSLSLTQAIPCSLLLNEIIVNAYKHAFTETRKGEIFVKMYSNDEKIFLSVTDDGKGISDNIKNTDSESLGMTLINTLAKQLGGKLTISPRDDKSGTLISVEFEYERIKSAESAF